MRGQEQRLVGRKKAEERYWKELRMLCEVNMNLGIYTSIIDT